MSVSRDEAITVINWGSIPPNGQDLKKILESNQYNRLGFVDNYMAFISTMLQELIRDETGIKTGAKVRVTLELVDEEDL